MRDYFKEVGEMYHRKALILVPLTPQFKPHEGPLDEDPFHGSAGFMKNSPEVAIRARTIGWLREKEPLVSGTLDELDIRSAMVFFQEHINGTLELSGVHFAIRYEMAALLYFNFEKICSALENDGTTPTSYAICLHQLIFDIEELKKNKRGQGNNEKREMESLLKERSLARDIFDGYPPDESGVICIPQDEWETMLDKHLSSCGPDGKQHFGRESDDSTIRKYKNNIKIIISQQRRREIKKIKILP